MHSLVTVYVLVLLNGDTKTRYFKKTENFKIFYSVMTSG